MGIAKTINAIGEYKFYTKDISEFVSIISSKFKVNLQVSIINMTSTFKANEKPDELYDFKFQETYELLINFYDYDDNHPDPTNTYCTYDLQIPINFKFEKALSLEFYPNGIFQLNYLPFSKRWRFFIDDIKGINDNNYQSRKEVVNEILEIRSCYITISKKIDCKEVVIWTDANYQTEDEFIFNQKPNKLNTLGNIKTALQELDKVTIYDLVESIDHKSQFDNRSDLNIAFSDTFENS